MSICLRGWVKNTKNELNKAVEILESESDIIVENLSFDSDEVEEAVFNIDNAKIAIQSLADIIVALLNGDMGHKEAIDFLALEGRLAKYKYCNELIIITKNEGDKTDA